MDVLNTFCVKIKTLECYVQLEWKLDFFSEVSCFIKFRTTSTLFSGMFWLGCYSCSCCDGNRIKSTPCSQTWTRTRAKQIFCLTFPYAYPYSLGLKPNCRVHKTWDLGIQDPKEGFAKWGRFHQKITLFVEISINIRKKGPQLLLPSSTQTST